MRCNSRGTVKFKLEQISSGTLPFRGEMSCHPLSPHNDAASQRAVGMLLAHMDVWSTSEVMCQVCSCQQQPAEKGHPGRPHLKALGAFAFLSSQSQQSLANQRCAPDASRWRPSTACRPSRSPRAFGLHKPSSNSQDLHKG